MFAVLHIYSYTVIGVLKVDHRGGGKAKRVCKACNRSVRRRSAFTCRLALTLLIATVTLSKVGHVDR